MDTTDTPDDNDSDYQIEAPITLLPDLSLWAIDEVDRGICEDSSENRSLLRENHATWIQVYTPDGRPTNLIQAVTAEMKQARLVANKSILLTDHRDTDSDYITGFKLIIEPRADDIVPAWVLAATRKWEAILEEREKRGADGKLFRPAVAGPPSRCRARRIDGHRCQNWMGGLVDQDGLCKMHIGTKANSENNFGANVVQRARNRIMSAAMIAAEGLEELAQTATSEPVRLGAMKELLDRSGIRAGVDIEHNVNINVNSAEQVVRDRLAEIAKRAATTETSSFSVSPTKEVESPEKLVPIVIDAEIVEDDEESGKTFD